MIASGTERCVETERRIRIARQPGLDPAKRLNHVEVVTAERIGLEPLTQVRSIYTYHIAYSLTIETREGHRR